MSRSSLSILVFFLYLMSIYYSNAFALPEKLPDQTTNRNSQTDSDLSSGSRSTKALEVWCVAKNNAEDSALQSALDWACGAGGADCGPIQNGGPCSDLGDIQSLASYAFNDYFRKNGLSSDSCNFGQTAALTALNPSHGSCIFPSSSSVRNGSITGSTLGTYTGVGGPTDLYTNRANNAFYTCIPSFIPILMYEFIFY